MEDWLFVIEAGFKRFKITSNADKLAELATYVEDEPFEILKEVSMNVDPQKRTMEEFKKRITDRFSDS